MQYTVEFVKAVTGAMVAGRPFSTFYLAGRPPAATAPTPGLGGVALTSYTNSLLFTNPSSGNTYVARLQASAPQGGTLLLCDRLWHNSGFTITSTSAQTVNSVAWPARDVAGSTNGEEVYIGVEVSTATGAGVPTLTMSYTNSAGTASRTGTNIVATVATSAAGTFYPLGLNAADTGVRSVQTFTLSATWTSGTIHLVAYRVLARLELTTAFIPNAADALTAGFARAYDNTVPFLIFIPQTTTTSNIAGHVIWTQG